MTYVRFVSHLLCLFMVVTAGLAEAQEARSQDLDTKAALSASTPANKASSSSDPVIIKVGDAGITRSEFESSIGDIEPKGDPDKTGASEKDRRRMGDDYASVLMLSQQAVADRLDSSPEIQRQLAVARMQILSDAEFARLMSQTKASSEEVHRYYDAHLSDFDRVRIRRLFIWKVGAGSKNTRGLPPEEAKARGAAILQESASGGDPARLAEMFRDSDQGILDAQPLIFLRGQLPAKLEKVAFAMKVGQWAEAEDTADHLILVYLAARDREPLPEVTSLIEKLVQGEKMQTTLNELKKKAGIWMDEQYFGSGSTVEKDSVEGPASKPLSEAQN